MTPGAPSPGGYNPHTPGSNIDQTSSDWVTTDIMVRVKDTFLDGGVINQTGVIRSVTVSVMHLIWSDFVNLNVLWLSGSRSMWSLDLHIAHVVLTCPGLILDLAMDLACPCCVYKPIHWYILSWIIPCSFVVVKTSQFYFDSSLLKFFFHIGGVVLRFPERHGEGR